VAEPSAPPADSRWVTASAELRSTAKWVITALAAVATVVFGAGPIITRPSLDFEDDRLQLVLAGLLGVAGLIGIGMLVFGVSKVFLPVEMSLDDLPPELLAKIESHPETLLPAGAPGLAQFRDQLAALRTAVVEIPEKVEELEARAGEAQRENDSAAYREAIAEVDAYRAALDDTMGNLATYESIRADLIDRGAFTRLSGVFSEQRGKLWTGALLAGIGGLGFQLALTSTPAGTDSASGTSSARGIAVLSKAGDGATQFWDTYGLKACETAAGQVPVLITGGAGTADSPYLVRTIPEKLTPASGDCPSIEFSAHPEVFAIALPKPQEITIKLAEK
jgi:hypothetical protein